MGNRATAKITRQDKNKMRDQLQQIINIHQQVNRSIQTYRQENQVPDYGRFWDELSQRNNETIQVVSRYMVRKCNR